jgi:molybdate transport system substrate-binding protein
MELKVLSGGAIQSGLQKVAKAFREHTGHGVVTTFNTAPLIRNKIENNGLSFDVIIAPLQMMREFERASHVVSGSSAIVGSVKAGVVVREGGWQPDISTAETLKEALIASESIVYNQGSSGIFAETLLQRLGIEAIAQPKATRLPDADAVMKHLASSRTTRAIGFGQVTAILLHVDRGVRLVGPLPKEVENITTYVAGVGSKSMAPEVAQQFVHFLITPSAGEAFKATGVE